MLLARIYEPYRLEVLGNPKMAGAGCRPDTSYLGAASLDGK